MKFCVSPGSWDLFQISEVGFWYFPPSSLPQEVWGRGQGHLPPVFTYQAFADPNSLELEQACAVLPFCSRRRELALSVARGALGTWLDNMRLRGGCQTVLPNLALTGSGGGG